MAEVAHPPASAQMRAKVSVPWVVLAAILCGLGVFSITYFVIFYYWPAFAGIGFLLAGALLLFHHVTGPDHA